MIKIDYEKCIGCMQCVAVCPFTVLEEKDGRPQHTGKYCLKCMHCGAVCPKEAIRWNTQDSILRQELPGKREGFDEELRNHILSRRSYRHFSEKPVPRELLEEALELASWAPSAKNQHPTKWIIIESQETMKQIMDCILAYVEETGNSPEIASEFTAGNNVVMGTSSALILAYARDNALYPETDTVIAMTTAELYLQAKGVRTCWAGYLKRMCNLLPEIRALLPALPENNSFYGALMVGYPENERYFHIPERLKRADIKRV